MMWFSAPKEPPVKIFVGIYRIHVIVFMGWSVDDMIADGIAAGVDEASFTPDWVKWMRETVGTAEGICAHFGATNSDILIWLPKRPDEAREYGTLWHELSHAVDKIAKHCDPNHHFFSENMMSEPRAYLMEYLAVEITRDLWNRSPASGNR
jgi:hypothetical protein